VWPDGCFCTRHFSTQNNPDVSGRCCSRYGGREGGGGQGRTKNSGIRGGGLGAGVAYALKVKRSVPRTKDGGIAETQEGEGGGDGGAEGRLFQLWGFSVHWAGNAGKTSMCSYLFVC
jgi:hypothetical protein